VARPELVAIWTTHREGYGRRRSHDGRQNHPCRRPCCSRFVHQNRAARPNCGNAVTYDHAGATPRLAVAPFWRRDARAAPLPRGPHGGKELPLVLDDGAGDEHLLLHRRGRSCRHHIKRPCTSRRLLRASRDRSAADCSRVDASHRCSAVRRGSGRDDSRAERRRHGRDAELRASRLDLQLALRSKPREPKICVEPMRSASSVSLLISSLV
jgi:hypothetical protein